MERSEMAVRITCALLQDGQTLRAVYDEYAYKLSSREEIRKAVRKSVVETACEMADDILERTGGK